MKMKTLHLGLACLLLGTSALAAAPTGRPAPCQPRAPERSNWPQSTLLWGATRQVPEQEMSSVLVSLQLDGVRRGGAPVADVRLEDGRLVAPSLSPRNLAGTTLRGAASDGQPVEVALCGAEPSEDASLLWYRIEVWNPRRDAWENPCIATHRAPQPRALAVPGVWDSSGARKDEPGRFTFACENGAIAKCVTWGYAPWASKEGQSLAPLHQACTRMARADYCGDGHSHTREETLIDVYDRLGVLRPTQESTAGARASFEAAWSPEGASCLARARYGQPLDSILARCPGRFERASVDLGDGDTCALRRKGFRASEAPLRNRHLASAP